MTPNTGNCSSEPRSLLRRLSSFIFSSSIVVRPSNTRNYESKTNNYVWKESAFRLREVCVRQIMKSQTPKKNSLSFIFIQFFVANVATERFSFWRQLNWSPFSTVLLSTLFFVLRCQCRARLDFCFSAISKIRKAWVEWYRFVFNTKNRVIWSVEIQFFVEWIPWEERTTSITTAMARHYVEWPLFFDHEKERFC